MNRRLLFVAAWRWRLPVIGVVALFASVPALALNVLGTQGDDILRGTATADWINGKAGDDRMFGLSGDDMWPAASVSITFPEEKVVIGSS
jgi:Ca2+-binding RTX toxin-like protein